jgi:MoxR-like ATPase
MGVVMMPQNQQLLCYEGYDDLQKKKPEYQPDIDGSGPDDKGRFYYPYFPTKELQEVVNLAIALGRPLLIDGEPGCGKTRLAEAIAYEFSLKARAGKEGYGERCDWWTFEEWNVKSVGQAQDGLYRFDGLARLRDAQLLASDVLMPAEVEAAKQRLEDPSRKAYIAYGALGEALRQESCQRPIVLIDEIDKADSDFPNDLLRELERLEFTVAETQVTYPIIKPKPKPIVLITSNQERPLPEAFLRRCLYFKLPFPDERQLSDILLGRFKKLDGKLVEAVIQHFLKVRRAFVNEPGSKPPGTSEILDFLMVIQGQSIDEARKTMADLPQRPSLLGIILKSERDQKIYCQAVKSWERD